MEKDYTIKIEDIYIGIDDNFSIDGVDVGKRFYIPDAERLFHVDVVSTSEYPNHEDMAEVYVRSNEQLNKKYIKFKDKTRNTSYKDFLVFECDAIAVADKYTNRRAEITFKECDVSSMKKILNEFLGRGYKVVEPENPMLRGRY